MDSVSEWLDEFCEKRELSTTFLKKIVDTEESDEGVLSLFQTMGDAFSLHRIIIFECRNEHYTPTYTWSAKDTKPYQQPDEETVRAAVALTNDIPYPLSRSSETANRRVSSPATCPTGKTRTTSRQPCTSSVASSCASSA